MVDKDEALFLADELEAPLGTVISSEVDRRAAAELRRLHSVNAELERARVRDNIAFKQLLEQRDVLLKGLQWIATVDAMDYEYKATARAAIAALL
jgi:hypothetical protein